MTEPPVHATSVAIGGRALLITGPSGSGKSDLALRLIDRGAVLVSDDYTLLRPGSDGALLASAPAAIAGRLEVRHLGILPFPWVDDVPVALMIQLVDRPERMPDLPATTRFAGHDLATCRLCAHEASAPIKAELALARLATGAREA